MPKNYTFDGHSVKPWIGHIKKIIVTYRIKSILDYGCGKAKYYNHEFEADKTTYKNLGEYWNITEIKLFDPGLKKYEEYPKKNYDGVICTDVLEHIHLNDLKNIVSDIFSLSNKFVFCNINCIR